MADDRDARIAQLEVENAALRAERDEALEQQTATAEVLRTMASPEHSLHAVLAALEQRASQPLGTAGAVFYRINGNMMRRLVAADDVERDTTAGAWIERPVDRFTFAGRTVLDRRPHHVRDAMDPDEAGEIYPIALERIRLYQGRTLLTVPLMRGAEAIGAVLVYRAEVRSFTDREIALLETFADQAVIAIENARLFDELQEKTRQLAEASQHKSQFLANMSHELRTPLNAIIGYSEMLQEEAEDLLGEETLIPDLQKVNAAGKHLLGLINDILDLSKIEAGRMDLDLSTFEISGLVQDVAAIAQPLVEKNGNTLVVTCPDDLGTMHADQTKLRQTLFNLLSNAAKFTDHGTIELRVARAGASESGVKQIDEEGREAGRLGLDVDQIDTWEPAPTPPM